MAIALVFGGGKANPTLAYALQFVASLVLLAVIGLPSAFRALGRTPILVRCFIAAALLLPLFQIIPFPSAWFQIAPGRQVAVALRDMVAPGVGWWPITLAPISTVQTEFSLIMLATLLAAVLSIDDRGIRTLIWTVLIVAGLSVLVGVAQLTSGGTQFNFFDSGHRANLIGFFANRNHTASFLACVIPLVGALLASGRGDWRRVLIGIAFAAASVMVAVLGTVSRTGLLLTAASAVASVWLIVRFPAARARIATAVTAGGGALFALFLFTNATVSRVFDRYADVGEDVRWRIWVRAWAIMPSFLPWGAGLGSFVPVYSANEPLSEVEPTYANNAHCDYLELLLEAGIPGMVVVALLFAAVIWCALALRRQRPADRLFAYAGLIIVLVLLAHSAVDYPLRRMAAAVMFTIGFGLLVRGGARAAAADTIADDA